MGGKAKTLNALTGLRFIAALAVFVHHVTEKLGVHVKWPLGAQAVSFFFVLSGFILTYVYHDRLKWDGIKKFYFTRWARIWPLHLVCLLLILGLLHNLRLFSTDPEHWSKLLANVFLLQSWVPDLRYLSEFNGVAWSISTEMFFYLMFPLFLLGGQKRFWLKYVGLLLTTVVLVTAGTMISHTNLFPYVDYARLGHTNPLLRLPEFCTGMAVGFVYLNREKVKAAIVSQKPRSFALDTLLELAAFGAIFGSWFTIKRFVIGHVTHSDWGGPFLSSFVVYTSGCFVFAGVIYLFSRSSGLISRLCSTRAMVFLGEVSFAFYMVHVLVIRLVEKYCKFFGDVPPLFAAIALGLLTLSASIVLFKIVEMPSKKGLLALYDGKWIKGLASVPVAAWGFLRCRLSPITFAFAFGSVVLLNQYRPVPEPPISIDQIVANTDPECRGIEFDDAIELLGYQARQKEDGIEITLGWEKRRDFAHTRFIHICDEQGKIVRSGPAQEKRFHDAGDGDQIVDTVYLEKARLAGGSAISIGFYGDGIGMMKVSRGPRSMHNLRLDLISPEEFSRLSDRETIIR